MKVKMNHAPMGWNSYDYYDTTVTEEAVKANADYMAAHLKEFGWEYIIVDIEWYAKRAGSMRDSYQYIPFGEVEMDDYGRLLPDTERFPSAAEGKGFGPLAEYVHKRGLKFGIHIMRGIPREAAHRHFKVLGCTALASDIADPSSICGWNPDMYGIRAETAGSQEYYDSIISLYADWGVDFIKCDDICNTNLYVNNPYSAAHEVEMIAKAIEKCGREIVLSLSPGPALIDKAGHYEKYANMWRITDDFWDSWELLLDMFGRCELWQNHVSEGSYPDCDMLPLGILGKGFGRERRTNLTKDEQMTMMTLWCIFGSPLMLGAEMTKMDDWTLSLLTRPEILKLLSNDYVGRQAKRNASYAVWSCYNRKTEERFLAFFNFEQTAQEISVSIGEVEQFAQIDRDGSIKTAYAEEATELWLDAPISFQGNLLKALIPPHGTRLFALK